MKDNDGWKIINPYVPPIFGIRALVSRSGVGVGRRPVGKKINESKQEEKKSVEHDGYNIMLDKT